MTTTVSTIETGAPARGARIALFVAGLLAVGFGISVLAWPAKTGAALTGVIALYALIAGVVYIALGFVSKTLSAAGRVGHVLLGLLYVAAGIYAFSSLQRSAAFLAIFLTIMLGVMWIIEGFTALFTLGAASARGAGLLTMVFAIISIVAGFTLLSSPLWGAMFLWWFLGIGLIVLGLLNIIRATTWKKA